MGCPIWAWEGRRYTPTHPPNPTRIVLRRNLLMQANGSLQVSPKSGVALPSGQGEVCLFPAGVAQLVEHLFCKQAVRGSSPLASSAFEDTRHSSEGCPSGQREQAVNLPDLSYVGSNPTPSTRSAGVAQLVERQPSKLNVVGSSPISRSPFTSSAAKIRTGQPPRTWRTRVLRIVSSVPAVHGSALGPVRRALPRASCVQGSAPLRLPLPT